MTQPPNQPPQPPNQPPQGGFGAPQDPQYGAPQPPAQPPQMRANLWDTLEFSGRIGLPSGRAVDEAVVALLPDGYWPAVPRTVPVASDANRRELHLDISPEGRMTLRVQDGGSVKATWLSLDSASCRIDGDDG
ncbi:hypothetical protein HRW13_28060 [Streptomyces lunaelactis]|uniref:hypothetical protein n=1 Tax=Streptomyces lunaelactis TaxID=1535768 RepID=UPI0015857FDD|nr:hypothetical protein [Streptomyces lunaelactis]NUK44646.1 hypothetical protein [Streptomyces lunaelactis]